MLYRIPTLSVLGPFMLFLEAYLIKAPDHLCLLKVQQSAADVEQMLIRRNKDVVSAVGPHAALGHFDHHGARVVWM